MHVCLSFVYSPNDSCELLLTTQSAWLLHWFRSVARLSCMLVKQACEGNSVGLSGAG